MIEQDDGRLEAEDANAVLTTGDGEDVGGGAKDDLEGGTTGAASMIGGGWGGSSNGQAPRSDEPARAEAAPGGRVSPAGEALGPIGDESFSGSPVGEPGGGESRGPAAEGSFGSGTYNERGRVTGPDSPAGSDADLSTPEGQGQGDDLANRLGGGDNARTGLTGAGAASGDMRADRSEATGAAANDAAGSGGPSAGDVGGMGGVRGHTAASSRPPGGESPLQHDPNHRD